MNSSFSKPIGYRIVVTFGILFDLPASVPVNNRVIHVDQSEVFVSIPLVLVIERVEDVSKGRSIKEKVIGILLIFTSMRSLFFQGSCVD